ncbi:hypothetical protein [Ilumatobacter sp.]|uniref:hypothetical protein n=1 Tax=Ilumatobacter sp. TaxID=1967498 RepID=UPI003B51A2D3
MRARTRARTTTGHARRGGGRHDRPRCGDADEREVLGDDRADETTTRTTRTMNPSTEAGR